MSNHPSPLQNYHQQIAQGKLYQDPKQLAVVEHFETIYHQLIERQKFRNSQFGKLRRKIKPKTPVRGLYIWGNVGSGKTHLMDSFYECLTVKKMRVHFHEFMQKIHTDLAKIQGKENPLKIIAKNIADDYLIICFDEFFVSNITDAMLLAGLFRELFRGGLCLVASSNVAPDDLYKNGLQRERFLPAIELIKKYTTALHLQSDVDYRLHYIRQAGVYYTPLNEQSIKDMEQSFKHYSLGATPSFESIELFGRKIKIQKQSEKTIWFDFKDICGRPRSQKDYLQIAKQYDTVLISNIPIIEKQDLIVSFINLIDVLYDSHIRVVISAQTSADKLYTGKEYQFEFKRTQSRLIEMQSEDYFFFDYKDV